jgi:tetratricopeptide (TPR) repeat protein
MAISGELLSVDLSNVFQMLSLNRKRGLLHIRDQENVLNERWIVFDEDRIGLYEVPQTGDVWALLVDSGDVGYAEYRAARDQAREYGSHHDRLLRQRGLVDEDTYARAARRVQEEHLLEIFLWREVTFTLDEERVPDPLAERELYGIDLLVMEAARRQDEWQRAIELLGGERDIWGLPPMPKFAAPPTDHLEPTACLVLDEVDGVRGTTEIMAATGLPRYHVDLALCRLMQEKLLRRLGGPELVEQATQLLAEERVGDAVRLLELANELNPDDFEIHLRLAEAHLKKNEVSKATEHYKVCSELLLAMERTREAVDILHDIMRFVPTDFVTLKRAIELIASEISDYSDIDEDLFAQGVKLFHFHLESSQYDEATDLLGLLIEIAPHDVGLNLQRARLLVKTGYVEEGVDIYLKVAGKLLATKDLESAERIYRTVRGTDPINEKVRGYCDKRLAQIEEIRQKRKRRKRAGLGVGLMLVGLGLAGLGYFVYQDRASGELDKLRRGHEQLVTSEDWRAARESYRSFARRYPITFAATRADALISEADKMISRFEREEALAARTREEERQGIFRRAEKAYGQAVLHQQERRLRQAREAYREALELASKAGRRDWALAPNRDLGARVNALTLHLDREEVRREAFEKARSEGRLAEAHALGRELLEDALGVEAKGRPLRMVDRDVVDEIILPFRVDRIPANASMTLDGRPVPPGALTFELGASRPRARICVSAPGYRQITREIDWRRSGHESMVVLERVAEEKHRLGQSLQNFLIQDGRIVAADANGGLHRLNADGSAIEKSWRPTRLTSRLGPPELTSRGVLLVSNREILIVDVSTGRRVWERRFATDLVAYARRGERLLLARSGETPELLLVSLGQDHSERRWTLPGLPRRVLWGEGGRFAVLLGDGRILRGQSDRAELAASELRARPDRAALAAELLVVADPEGGISAMNLITGAIQRLWAPPRTGVFVRRGPEQAGRRVVAVSSEGAWFAIDERGQIRQGRGHLPGIEAGTQRSALSLSDGGKLFLPCEDGGLQELDLEGMRPRGRLSRPGRRTSGAVIWRRKLVASYQDSDEIDVFDVGN